MSRWRPSGVMNTHVSSGMSKTRVALRSWVRRWWRCGHRGLSNLATSVAPTPDTFVPLRAARFSVSWSIFSWDQQLLANLSWAVTSGGPTSQGLRHDKHLSFLQSNSRVRCVVSELDRWVGLATAVSIALIPPVASRHRSNPMMFDHRNLLLLVQSIVKLLTQSQIFPVLVQELILCKNSYWPKSCTSCAFIRRKMLINVYRHVSIFGFLY